MQKITTAVLVAVLLSPPHVSAENDWLGLKGKYFGDADLREVRVTRLDEQVDFNWGFGSPDWRIGSDWFSARWTGKIVPRFSEPYTFFLRSDDGARLWIDGRLVVDDSTGFPGAEAQGSISLLADRPYDIKLEYIERWGLANVVLSWSSRREAKQIVPRQRLRVAAAPQQPADGPGGASYPHASVKESIFVPSLDGEYRLFEPQMPALSSAPVVIFLHGWGGLDPGWNRAWIDHIVRRGNVVVWPRYQASLLTPPQLFTSNAIAAIKLALNQLAADWPARPRPDLNRIAAIGHSMGGILAANIAATAAAAALPRINPVMAVTPGTGGYDDIITDLSSIPDGTLLLALAASEDTDFWSRLIMQRTLNIAPKDKNHILVNSDDHGWPELSANHLSPIGDAAQGVDALDWYGYWKWADALIDAAFYGTHREYALGDTPQQRDMGRWSDGTAVKPATVTIGSALPGNAREMRDPLRTVSEQ